MSQIFVPFYSYGTCKIDFATVNVIKLKDSKDNSMYIDFVSSQDADDFVAELVEF